MIYEHRNISKDGICNGIWDNAPIAEPRVLDISWRENIFILIYFIFLFTYVIFLFLLWKIGFATIDSVSNFKLMDAGVSKENITILHSVAPVLNTIVPLIVAKYTSGPKALNVYLKIIPYR